MSRNLVGKKFGKLTVIEKHPVRKNKRIQWICRCDCGNEAKVVTYRLNNGETKSCGCLRKSKFDLVNKHFGDLIVIRKHPQKNKHGAVQWHCKCACGRNIITTTSHLRNGSTKSCGKHKGTHRNAIKGSESAEYQSWLSMRGRCTNKDNARYKDYGGRGITFCKRWDSFENFLTDMGEKSDPSHSLERIDNDKGYNPSNCVWADATTQNRNQRIRSSNTSGINGVHWRADTKKWVVRISVNYKRIHIGTFVELEDARIARKEAEIKYWNK